MSPANPNRLLCTKEAADYLSVSPNLLEKWRTRRRGPAWLELEGTVRYRESALTAYLDSAERRNEAMCDDEA